MRTDVLFPRAQGLVRIVSDPCTDKQYALHADFLLLAHSKLELAEALLRDPLGMFELFDEVLSEAQISQCKELMRQQEQQQQGPELQVQPKDAHVRFHNLPLEPSGRWRPSISGVRAHHIGHLITIHGTVIKACTVKMFEHKRVCELQAPCSRPCEPPVLCRGFFILMPPSTLLAVVHVYAVWQRVLVHLQPGDGRRGHPARCLPQSRKAVHGLQVQTSELPPCSCLFSLHAHTPLAPRFHSTTCTPPFLSQVDDDSSKCFTGYQEAKVQEKSQSLNMGCMPCSIQVLVQHEMADTIRPGGATPKTLHVHAEHRGRRTNLRGTCPKPNAPSLRCPLPLSDALSSDDVQMTGVVIPRWDGLKAGERCSAELVLVVHHAVVEHKTQAEVEVPPNLEAAFLVRPGEAKPWGAPSPYPEP